MPLVRPLMIWVVALDVNTLGVCALPPMEGVTVYPVIGSPPLFDGALHDKVTEPSPAVPLTAVGAPGTVAGVMAAEGVEGVPVPALVVALTVKV